MKRILIAYANSAMKYSLKQLKIQARYIKNIDDAVFYTEKDLPSEIAQSPLMKYKRGGGYWIWKPYIIWKTLQDYPEGTKVCYIDAGCSIYSGKEWDIYWNSLDKYDTILFQYAQYIQKWAILFGCGKSDIECWTKKNTLDFFDKYLGTSQYHTYSKIWGGMVLCKGKHNYFIKEWLDITLKHPELIIDPSENEQRTQHANFCGHHRHDQSIITPLAFKYKTNNILILPEVFDENIKSTIVHASRNRITKKMYYRVYFKYHLQGFLGVNRYNMIKRLLNIQ